MGRWNPRAKKRRPQGLLVMYRLGPWARHVLCYSTMKKAGCWGEGLILNNSQGLQSTVCVHTYMYSTFTAKEWRRRQRKVRVL